MKDLQQEFQIERTDMLETMRQLTRSVKLKDLIIANFIPEEYAKSIERRAQWNPEDDCWIIAKLELTGNNYNKIATRPISNPKLKRPETEYTKSKRQYDASPRYRYENVATLELELPEKTTQEFEGPGKSFCQ